MKRAITGIVAAGLALGMMAPAAFAATTSSTIGGQKAISVNGSVVSNPYTRVANDAGTQTSYIGVWYLGQAVKSAGGDYSWDPTAKVFNIVAPGVDASKISLPGGVGTGNTDITVNGVLVKKVNSFAAQDPAGGKSDVTTFMPLFYLGEIFNNLGGSSWDGNTFALKKFVQVGNPAAVTLSASTTNLVADNSTAATSTVTGSVVDANGNVVTSYNGPVTVTLNGNDVSLDQATYTAVNGKFTVQVTNKSTAVVGHTDQILASLPGVSGSTGTATLAEIAPVATYVEISGAPKALEEVSSSATLNYTLTTTDQLHQPIAASNNGQATVAVSGPATFTNGTTSQVINVGGTISLTQNANETGVITLYIASVNGTLKAGNPVSINVVAPGTATSFSLTSSAPATSYTADTVGAWTGSSAYVTLQAQDVNGLAVAPSTAPTATVTVNGATASDITASVAASGTTGLYNVSLTGVAPITVGTYTLTVSDGSMTPFTQTFTVTPGNASKLVVTPASSLGNYDVTSTNPAAVISAQVTDQYGNAVAEANDPITFTDSTGNYLTLSGGAGSASAQTVYTNANGVATISAAATQAAGNGSVAVTGTSGTATLTGASSAAIYELGTQAVTQLNAKVNYASGSSYTAGSNAASGTNYPTVTVNTMDAAGAPFSSSDTLEYTIAGPSGYTGATSGTVSSNTVTLNSDVAGTYTVTIKDASNSSVAPVSATVTVVPGAFAGVEFLANGSDVSTGSGINVAADTPVALTVEEVDSSGNVVSSSTPVTVSSLAAANSSGAITSGAFKDASGNFVSSLTIPANQTSATVYYVNATAQTGVLFTATGTAAASTATLSTASVSGSTVTLGYSAPLTAGTVDASQFTVTVNGSNDLVTGASVSGSSVTLTLAAAPAAGATVTVSYVADSTAPVTDANGTKVADFSNQLA